MDCEAEGISTVYDLYGVSNHFGSLGGGHYTAYGKNPNGRWYNFNDSSVGGASAEATQSGAAYILFYRRRPDPKSSKKPDFDLQDSDGDM